MGWIFFCAFVVLVGIPLLFGGGFLLIRRFFSQGELETPGITFVVGLALIAIFAIWTYFASFHQIPYGHVGVVKMFGSLDSNVRGQGGQWIPPWGSIIVVSLKEEPYGTENLPEVKAAPIPGFPGHIGAVSKDNQDVYVLGSVKYKVAGDHVLDLLNGVKDPWQNNLIGSMLGNLIKEETVKYESTVVTEKREAIRLAILARLKEKLSPYSVEVVDFFMTNVDFKPEFVASIEKKQIAKQLALEEEAKVEVERQKGEQAKARAAGEAEAIRIKAAGEADANNLLAASLRQSPEVLTFRLIDKIGDKITFGLLPTGSNFILDLNQLGLASPTPTAGQ